MPDLGRGTYDYWPLVQVDSDNVIDEADEKNFWKRNEPLQAKDPAGQPPQITAQPQSQTVTVGGTVTFTVVATGTAPLSYQWRRDGQPLAGQTGPSLTLANVQSAQAGSYTVVVSNSAGQVTSNPAVLTVNPAAQAPTITAHPQSQTVTVGGTVTFTAQVSGSPSPTFQWQRSTDGGTTWNDLSDGNGTSGSRSVSLSIAGVASSMNGHRFRLRATSSAGEAVSLAATLTVTPGPAPRHPADVNPPDNRLTLAEVIAYAAAYKRSQTWPEGPNPIPLDYVVRAAALYLRGETYHHDPTAGSPPLGWVNAPEP